MRSLRLTLWLLGLALLAVPGFAQTAGGSQPIEGDGFPCICGTTLLGSDVCWEDNFCADSANCDAANPCEPGFQCIVNECCNNSPTVGKCLATCPAGGTCYNPGVCGTFEVCDTTSPLVDVPTLNYVGLGVLLLLLVATAIFVLRRNRRAPAA